MTTRLVVPYDTERYPYSDLANWSTVSPFVVDGRRYPSVDHYVFCELTNHMDDALLLSATTTTTLRTVFNLLSDSLFFQSTQRRIQEGVSAQFRQNMLVRTYFQEEIGKFFYYMNDDDILFGINHEGYGYNLVGIAYARLVDKTHSSYYALTESNIFRIYQAQELLVHHMQQGHDIIDFIGQDVDAIHQYLGVLYPSLPYLSSATVWTEVMNNHNPRFQNIQLEIDYPLNLAGFVRKQHIVDFNFRLRKKFNRLMLSKYFGYVLRKRFRKDIDVSQIESFYVPQQLTRMSITDQEQLATMLYNMYNDPSTNDKTLVFLQRSDLETLHAIELQFLSPTDIARAQRYVPFLYRIKQDNAVYVYDVFTTPQIQPSTTTVTPFTNFPISKDNVDFPNLVSFVFTEMATMFTRKNLGDQSNEMKRQVDNPTDIVTWNRTLTSFVNDAKRTHVNRGILVRIRAHRSLQYLLFNTHRFGNNIVFQDPDEVLQRTTNERLVQIRASLTQPYFPIAMSLLPNRIDLQDRIRFRLEDFQGVMDAYRLFVNTERIGMDAYDVLQRTLWRNPTTPESTRPMDYEFFQMFDKRCTNDVIQKLWKFFGTYALLLESKLDALSSNVEMATKPIASIVAYFVKTFYTEGTDDLKFCEFVLTVLLGRRIEFMPSLTYYSSILENQLRHYIDIDEYTPEFIINLFGVMDMCERQIPKSRHVYFSALGLAIHTPPFESTLSTRFTGMGIIRTATTELRQDKRRKRRAQIEAKRRQQEEQDRESIESDEEDDDQREDNIREMLEEMGLDTDSESESSSSDSDSDDDDDNDDQY